MGITPIANLSQLPMARSVESELEPLPMARVENSARTDDETYSPSNGRSARGADDDDAADDLAELPDEEEAESARQPAGKTPSSQISFFA